MFSCVWLHFKIFFEKYFLTFGKEVGKEEGRGKTQKNPDKPRRTRRDLAMDGAISDRDRRRDLAKRRSRLARTVLREIVIDGAISQSVDRNRRERCFARSRRRIAIVSAISRSTVRVDHDLANGASREIAPLNPAFFLSLVLPLREPSLRVPSSGNHLK